MRNISKTKQQFEFDGEGIDLDEIFAQMEKTKVRIPVKAEPLETFPKAMRFRFGTYRGHKTRLTRVLGAAGPEEVPEQKLKIISDHYTSDTRRDISDVAHTDPIIAPALIFRMNGLFEDGFDLKFKIASQFDPTTGEQLTPEQINERLEKEQQNYLKTLAQLSTWKDDRNILQVAKDLEVVSIAQGKAAALISPGIMDLQAGQLPFLVEIITADDLSNPIIDAGLTRRLVACKLNLDDKPVARADELIYITRGIRGLRREAKFHGTSAFEPILKISMAIKRYYNLDAPLAMIAAYISRLLIKVKQEGDTTTLNTRIQTFMNKMFKASNWAMAMPEWYGGVDTVQPKVDFPMFSGIEDKLANVELAQLGVPKSTQNREQNLNRDTATIEAIQFVRFIRKPSENDMRDVLENQLFNPLLTHLIGRPLSEIPVRIEVVRRVPQEGDLQEIYEKMSVMPAKENELEKASLRQADTKGSPFGASGSTLKVTEQDDGSFHVTSIGTPGN